MDGSYRGVAALVGNGLSIAFNPDLTIPRINDAITARLNQAGSEGTLPARIMQRAAANIDTGDPQSDFEALLGPLDQYRDGLRMFRELAHLAGEHHNAVMENALTLSAEFTDALRRWGVSHALEVIAERSKAKWRLKGKVDRFIRDIVEAADGAKVHVGNLNYDALVMASLSEQYQPRFCDMSDGQPSNKEIREVIDGMGGLVARPVRLVTSDFPDFRQITLLHLHGSLAWLREPGPSGRVYRFEIGDLREQSYWKAWREGRTQWVPEVVLTNQATKSNVVSRYPFNLAYDKFYEGLLTAERWLIAGYSFRDACVNDLIKRAWDARRTPPQVLVVTKGDLPIYEEILAAIGWDPIFSGDPDPSTWLHVHRGGIETAAKSADWAAWTDSGAARQAG